MDPWTNANRSLSNNLFIYDEPRFIKSLDKRRDKFQTMEHEYDKQDIIRPEHNGMKISSKLGPLECTIGVIIGPTIANFLAQRPQFYGTFGTRNNNQKGNFGETVFAFLCEKLNIPAMPTATNAPIDFRTQLYYTKTQSFDLFSIWHDAYEIKYSTQKASKKALTHPYQLKHIMVTVYEENERKCILRFHHDKECKMNLLPQFAKLNNRIITIGDGRRTLQQNVQFFDSEYPPQTHTTSETFDTPNKKKRTIEPTFSEAKKQKFVADPDLDEFYKLLQRPRGLLTRRGKALAKKFNYPFAE